MPATLYDTTARTCADLAAIREQWGDLLAAIDGPRDRTWPPRDNITEALRPDDEPALGRIPLTLREHPAPVNLDALDAAVSTERDLFDLADRLADAVQRPVRRRPIPRAPRMLGPDPEDRDDPRRWHLPTHRAATLVRGDGISTAGSRRHGLHWAAVWIEGRLAADDTGDLFAHVPARLADQAASTIRQCARRIDRALNRDTRVTTLDRTCPWCRGPLTARTAPGFPERSTVECRTGHDCTAPVPVTAGRRLWRAPDLPALYAALTAAEQRSA